MKFSDTFKKRLSVFVVCLSFLICQLALASKEANSFVLYDTFQSVMARVWFSTDPADSKALGGARVAAAWPLHIIKPDPTGSSILKRLFFSMKTSSTVNAGTDAAFTLTVKGHNLSLPKSSYNRFDVLSGSVSYPVNVQGYNINKNELVYGDIKLSMNNYNGYLPEQIWVIGETLDNSYVLIAGTAYWPSNYWFSTDSTEGASSYPLPLISSPTSGILKKTYLIHQTAISYYGPANTDSYFRFILKGYSADLNNVYPYFERDFGITDNYSFTVQSYNLDSATLNFGDIRFQTKGNNAWLPESIWVIGETTSGQYALLAGTPNWASTSPIITVSRNYALNQLKVKLVYVEGPSAIIRFNSQNKGLINTVTLLKGQEYCQAMNGFEDYVKVEATDYYGSVTYTEPNEPVELIQNSSFDTGVENWYCVNNAANVQAETSWDTADNSTAPGSLKVQCSNNGDSYTDIQLLTNRFNLIKDRTYLLTFKAKSSAEFSIHSIKLNQAGSPWADYAAPYTRLPIGTCWRDYAAIFTANATVSDARLTFFLGGAIPDGAIFNLDDVSLKEFTVNAPTPGELVPNPGFELGKSGWSFYSDPTAQAYGYLDPSDFDTAPVSYRIECIQSGSSMNAVQLFTMPLNLEANKNYRLTFKAKCSSNFAIPSIRLMKATSPWTIYARPFGVVSVTTDWQTYSVTFTANTTASDGRLTFFLGNALPPSATFWIDSLSLKEVAQ
ncbi:MAG TPA: carbohydrate binding domain-containing protein [Bacillota bacterium]|nr:carbohydrate binding domain-containing protein [Bacillota bacterium]